MKSDAIVAACRYRDAERDELAGLLVQCARLGARCRQLAERRHQIGLRLAQTVHASGDSLGEVFVVGNSAHDESIQRV